MQQVLLFTVEFLSPITLGTVARNQAFSKAIRDAVEGPLKTLIGFEVGELSSGLEIEGPKYPNHWIMEMWCDNVVISVSDLKKALSKLKWMHVTSCTRRVRRIPADPPKDKLTSRLKDRTPEKRLAHKEAQKRHLKNLDDAYGKDRPYRHKVLD
jgi:hypothetical protein